MSQGRSFSNSSENVVNSRQNPVFHDSADRLTVELSSENMPRYNGRVYKILSSNLRFRSWPNEVAAFGCEEGIDVRLMFENNLVYIECDGGIIDFDAACYDNVFGDLVMPIVLKGNSSVEIQLQYSRFCKFLRDNNHFIQFNYLGPLGIVQLISLRGRSYLNQLCYYTTDNIIRKVTTECGSFNGTLPDDIVEFDQRLLNQSFRATNTINVGNAQLQRLRAAMLLSSCYEDDVLRPQSKKVTRNSLNEKGLGSKLCREDRVAFTRRLTIEQKVALEKSPKRARTKSIEEARDAKMHKQYPFYPQSGWSLLPSIKTEHKHTIDIDDEMKAKLDDVWAMLHHGTTLPVVKVAHTIGGPLMTELGGLVEYYKPLSVMSLAVSVVMNYCHKGENTFWRYCCNASMFAVGVWLPFSYKKMLEKYTSDESLRPEIDAGDISRFAGIIYVGMSYLTIGEVKDVKSFEKVAMKACLFDKAKSGITEVISLVIDLVEKCINFIRTKFMGLDKLTIMSRDLPGLRKWCGEVETIVEISHSGELMLNTETAATVFRLEKEARAFETLKMSSSDAIQVRSALNSYRQALRSIVARFEAASLTGNGVRMEPVACLCVGETKVGKSTTADPLLRKFINRTLTPEERPNFRKNFNDYIYGYFAENLYMDNYRQQLAVYMDDYGQCIDVPGNLDNEHMKILRMVNTVPYTCHMADIGSKGNTPFTSKIIYATSNLTRIRPHSLYKPEAIARRFALIFRCIVKSEFAENPDAPAHERKLNTSHPKLNGADYFDGIHEYEMMYVQEGGTLAPTGEKLTEEELVDRFAKIYKTRKDFFEKYVRYINGELWEKEDEKTSLKPQSDGQIQMEEIESTALESIRMNLGPVEYINECYNPSSFGLNAIDVFGLILTSRQCHDWMRNYQYGNYGDCDEIWYEFVAEGGMSQYENRRAKISHAIYKIFKESKAGLYEAMDKIQNSVVTTLDELQKKHPLLFTVGSLISCAAALFGLYKLAKGILNKFTNKDDDELNSEGYNARKKGKLQAKRPGGIRTTGLRPEASRDPNSDQIAFKLVQKAMYSVSVSGDEGRLGLGMFVGGRVFMMPLHFIKHMKALVTEGLSNEGDFVILRNDFVSGTFKIQISEFLDPKNRVDKDDLDCTFVHLKSVAHHFKNSHLFITEEQRSKPLDLWCSLVGLDKHYNKTSFLFQPSVETKASLVKSDWCEDYTVSHGYKYMSQIGPGDCGFIMLISNLSVGPGKIMGMHVAGSDNGAGFSSSITKEIVESALSKWQSIDYPPPEELNLKPQCMELPFKGDFIPICYTEKAVTQPIKTKYMPSPIQGCLGPVNRFPAVLHRVDGVDPLAKSIEQYGKPKKPLDKKILSKAVGLLKKRYRREWAKFRKPRIYTFEEACKGISEVDFANAIPRNTSAGFPYVLNPQPGYRGKEWYFGTSEEYDFTRPQAIELREQVEEILAKASRGERSVHVCVDTKKDELRKQSKIDNIETRLISAGALPYLIACRMMTLDFSIFVMERNLQLGVGVGINPYSEDWNMLALKCQSKGSKIIAGDYSGFDTSCVSDVYVELVELINEFYGDLEKHKIIRRTLFADLYNSLHIYLNIIYMWLACMPSGHPLTAILNSLYNQVNLRYVWVKRKLHELFEFDDEVYESVYGDDILLNISDLVADLFNMNVLTEELGKIGFVFTDDMKNATSELYRDLTSVTYLKRSFRYEPLLRRYVAPLDFDSIKKSLDWVKKGPSSIEFCKGNVDNALVEFSLHDKADFSKWASIVVEVSRKILNHEPRETERYELLKFSAKIDQWM